VREPSTPPRSPPPHRVWPRARRRRRACAHRPAAERADGGAGRGTDSLVFDRAWRDTHSVDLSAADVASLRALRLDPLAKPSFESLKACLVWPDERPSNISSSGYELVCDLWATRGFMHRGLKQEDWGLDPAHFRRAWEYGLRVAPDWPGFGRLTLTAEDRVYLERCLADGDRI
jgi:hypothetical protein